MILIIEREKLNVHSIDETDVGKLTAFLGSSKPVRVADLIVIIEPDAKYTVLKDRLQSFSDTELAGILAKYLADSFEEKK